MNNLFDNLKINFQAYLNSESWEKIYAEKIKNIDHDEPWLTLISAYSIFGNQQNINEKNRLEAINSIILNSGIKSPFNLTSIDEVKVEEKLPEIMSYRKYLKQIFNEDNFHLYPDKREAISNKLENVDASFEGNTNLDLKIIGNSGNSKKYIYIESKFLSDISYQITYNPVRDQIIRNIDNGIELIEKFGEEKNIKFDDFYFFLLTPKIFKTDEFGGNKNSAINHFQPQKGRLYCYKMNDYKNPENLKQCLPHRKLKNEEWQIIAENIGWITFEDFHKYSNLYSTIEDQNEKTTINDFFIRRNLYER